MTARVSEGNGCAKLNEAVKCCEVGSIGPITLEVHNQSQSLVATVGVAVVAAFNQRTGAQVFTDKDTAVTAEDTGYDGDTTDKTFSGQTLNNLPVVPGSVVVKTASGSTMPNLTDTDADGILYDPSGNECGTIDYFTGALTLALGANTTAPGSVQINADYAYQNSTLKPGGKKNFYIASLLQDDIVDVKVACNDANGALIKVDAMATWL